MYSITKHVDCRRNRVNGIRSSRFAVMFDRAIRFNPAAPVSGFSVLEMQGQHDHPAYSAPSDFPIFMRKSKTKTKNAGFK